MTMAWTEKIRRLCIRRRDSAKNVPSACLQTWMKHTFKLIGVQCYDFIHNIKYFLRKLLKIAETGIITLNLGNYWEPFEADGSVKSHR
jgi:hypothetical protein